MKKVINIAKKKQDNEWGKAVENKNLWSFLEISPKQKEAFPSHNLQDHAYE